MSKYPVIGSKLNSFLAGVSSLGFEPVTFKTKGHGTVLEIIVGSLSFSFGLKPKLFGFHSVISTVVANDRTLTSLKLIVQRKSLFSSVNV